MYIVENIYEAKQEIKKSIFISYLCPVNEFETLHQRLKEQHPKAVHIVWAYRHYNKYGQIVENQSDDGEPKGTSGAPTLNAIRGARLVNSAVLIVRYFGGIKLGTGGLVRAYSGSANLAINAATLVKFELKQQCVFFISFALLARFEHFFEKESIEIYKSFNSDGVTINAECNKDEFILINGFAKSFHGGFEINVSGSGFCFLALPLFARGLL